MNVQLFVDTLLKVAVLILLAVPGYILTKLKKLGASAVKYLVDIIFYVCQPAIVLSAFQKVEYRPEMLVNMLIAFAVGFLGIFLITVSVLPPAKRLLGRDKGGIISYASAFGNVAFMGIPVVAMLLPDQPEALIYLTVFTVSFNMLSWTLGAYVMSGKREYISLKKAILNPPTLAVLIALPLFFLNFSIDVRIRVGITYLGDMVTPLSMTVLGIRFANIRLRELFNDPAVYAAGFLKLVFIPFLLYLLLLLLKLDGVLASTLYIIFLMPSASNLLLFAEYFDKNKETAAKLVLFTTAVSAITIPLMLMLPL